MRMISFVGGECFLLGAELDDHFSRAASYGFLVATTTNGYWAVNELAADRRMESAFSSGLRRITLSTGEMHAKYVPRERVVNAALAALRVGMSVSISVEDFSGTTFDWRSIVHHSALREFSDHPRLEIFLSPWISHADGIGTANLKHDMKHSRFNDDMPSGCDYVLDDLTVTPELLLTACCGYPLESIPNLHLGSVAEKTLTDVLESAPDDFLKVVLHVAGPEFVLRYVKKFLPDYQLPVQNVHICETCLHLHRDTTALAVFRQHAGEIETQMWDIFDVMRSQSEGRG